MISYFIVFLFVALFCWLAQGTSQKVLYTNNEMQYKKNKLIVFFLFISGSLLTLMAGFRYYVGTDYNAYYNLYASYKNFSLKNFNILNEPLMPIIGKIASIIYDNPHTMFLLSSIITVGVALYSIYKETTDYLFVTFLYIFVGCWHSTFNGMRQCLAVTIVFLGRKYITDRKLLKYLLICFIAFLAHRSALFCVLFYFIYSKKFSTRRLLLILITTILISVNYETVFGFIGWLNDSEFIANTYSERSVNFLRVLIGWCPAVLGIYYAYTKNLDKQQLFYVYLLVINAAIRSATADSAYLFRLGMFPAHFLPLGISCLTKLCKPQNYKVFRVCIITLYLLYWLYEITNSKTLSEFEWIFGNI